VSDRDVVRVILAPVRNASANCAPGCLASATASICVAWRTPRRPHRTMRRASCGRPQRRARRPVSRSHRQRGRAGWVEEGDPGGRGEEQVGGQRIVGEVVPPVTWTPSGW
jgi:hypothetical protein